MHMHSNEGDIKMHKNPVTIVLISYTLSKLYVDIKLDIFNMKFNYLFYLPMQLWASKNALPKPPKPGPGIPPTYVMVFFVINDVKWEELVL